MKNNSSQPDKRDSREVEFFVVNQETVDASGRFDGTPNTGTLITRNDTGVGILTHIPLQPGDMVRLKQGDSSSLGVVMWSIETADKFRIQMRFV